MKLHRFTASSNQKALIMIHESLGPDALIYSTRSVENGIEIVAGIPDEIDEHNDVDESPSHFKRLFSRKLKLDIKSDSGSNTHFNATADTAMYEKLNTQLQLIKDSMQNLTKYVDKRLHEGLNIYDDDHSSKRNIVLYHLNKLGFKGKFCQQFINHYFSKRNIDNDISISHIKEDLSDYIQTTDMDIVDGKNICALIGPTGIGKTTTILKLAKRYISKYGSESLGIITTDYHDISGKNLLLHYQNLYNIDLEFADTPTELSLVINAMKNKNLILIDTHGSSQRDAKNVLKLVELIESQGDKISPYIVLPSNVQEPILDEIAKAFKTSNLKGCIITKQDECINLAPALSVAMHHQMKIAYVCNGQDIGKNIECASKEMILEHIMSDYADTMFEIEEVMGGVSCN